MNVAAILSARAAEHPDRIALLDGAARRSVSYAQLDVASARAAAALRARGLQPGDTLLVVHPVSPELYVALIGALRAGLVPAIPPAGGGLRALAHCARLHPPRAVLGGGMGWLAVGAVAELRHAMRLSTAAAPFAFDVLASNLIGRAPVEPRDDDDPAMLTFTSGSTGDPKALVRSHGVARAQLDALRTTLTLDGVVTLCAMPMVTFAELAAGATCFLPGLDLRRPSRVDGDLLAARLRERHVERVVASPALLSNLAAALRRRAQTLPALRTIASGGAPVMPPLAGALRAVAPDARVLAVYGSTEAEPIAALDAAEVSAADHAAMRAGAGLLAGRPCDAGTIAIVAADPGALIGPFAHDDGVERRALPCGAVGEIVVRGPQVVPHYLDRAADATTKIRAGATIWHRTGDLGYRDEHGRLWLVGRASARVDDARGIVDPLRVECALSYLPQVARSAIAALDGARVLLVEPATGVRLDEAAIRAAAGFVAIDRIVIGTVPVDRRHQAKVDYAALARMLQRHARAA
jgi:acyl-CoA synthetase (AMP-forming)/AMP-acid ligase II